MIWQGGLERSELGVERPEPRCSAVDEAPDQSFLCGEGDFALMRVRGPTEAKLFSGV